MTIYHEQSSYCVYLTIYRGNKMPPFYIGSTSVAKVSEGYHGSVDSDEYRDIWKSELAANPHLFSTVIVSYTATRESAYGKEGVFHDKLNVVRSPLYINRSSASFRFDNTGKKMLDTQKKKISDSSKGHKKSEETRKRMRKPKTAEHNKKNSEARAKVATVTCPHCGKVGDPGVMSRWHFDNCKQNPLAPTRPPKTMVCCVCCRTETDTANHARHHGNRCKNQIQEKGA